MSKETVSKKKALGLGIKALLNNIDNELQEQDTGLPAIQDKNKAVIGGRIKIDQIKINPKQPRKDFDEESLKQLSESIKLHDIIQPITVSRMADGNYQLISGERRFRASKMAGLTTIPAYIRTVNNQELIELALLENIQREDLNAIEIALTLHQLIDEYQLTHEQVADRMHKNRSTVTNYLRLLKLPPDLQKAVRDEEISMAHARAILSLNTIEEQLYVYRQIKEKGLSVRQTEDLVKVMAHEQKSVPVSKDKTKLSPAFKRIEDDIASLFSTKVKLNRKKNGKGELTIEFYNDNDLERILDIMKL